MTDLPIDLAQVDWFYVLVLAVLVFVASGIGNLLGGRGSGAVLSAILFAAFFIGWTYYPHGLPLPTRLAVPASVAAPAPVAPAAPAAPVRPRNPVRDITPQPQ
jgi:hypothetical protein